MAVEALRSSDARSGRGFDLPADGVTRVRLTIDNRTDRTYAFAGTRVRLESQEGARAKPLTDAETVIKGFLYFPASAYRRATVVLIDQETEEEEGFSVEF